MSEQFSQEPESDPFEATDLDDLVSDEDVPESAPVESDGAGPQPEAVAQPEPEPEPEPVSPPPPEAGNGGAPETGDLVIDASLRDLADAPVDDLDAQIERGEQVQRTLQGRLSDLGG
ncbi:hypothetical protein ACOCJ7_05950 [Knoellia sp. CPCC 206453]|uniref:hypothetical protein n=1 Tax=Knoellia pratensis TaxID=3404796 RepID=UPI00360D2412